MQKILSQTYANTSPLFCISVCDLIWRERGIRKSSSWNIYNINSYNQSKSSENGEASQILCFMTSKPQLKAPSWYLLRERMSKRQMPPNHQWTLSHGARRRKLKMNLFICERSTPRSVYRYSWPLNNGLGVLNPMKWKICI